MFILVRGQDSKNGRSQPAVLVFIKLSEHCFDEIDEHYKPADEIIN